MHALVTGAAGFIGSRLARRLRHNNHQVTGLDSFTDYYDVALKTANAEVVRRSGASFIEGDLNSVDLDHVLSDIDVIFHLAGQPGVRASWGADFPIYTRSNVDATQRLLEACRCSRRIKRFVYASSSSVYGDAECYPTTENMRPQPVSPYGVTKLAGEHLCCLYAKNFGVPTVSLRYFTVYGPGQRPDMAFTRFIKSAIQGQELQIYGSGEQVRDFTYVDDVVEANLLAATKDVRPGIVLNVAGGSHTTVNQVLTILEELTGSALMRRHIDAVAGDVRQTGGDTSGIRSALGWEPSVNLRDGLARQLEWLRNGIAEN
jgi:nucleoside-diphosphate-sugar epimerase